MLDRVARGVTRWQRETRRKAKATHRVDLISEINQIGAEAQSAIFEALAFAMRCDRWEAGQRGRASTGRPGDPT